MSRIVKFCYQVMACVTSKPSVYLLTILLLLGPSAFAQESTYAQKKPKDTKEHIERIAVSGQHADMALRAFNSGDYSLAEIEFKENADCALRAEMNQADYLESFQTGQANQLAQAESESARIGTNPSTVNVNINTNVTYTPSSGVTQQKLIVRERTCENRGFQIYMTGMSQIQLGRSDEAEVNLEQAIKIDKYLYDAHYRLGLMKLLRQDKEGVSKHLSGIESALDRCHNCDFRHKIESRMKFLKHALDGKIKLN
ncbi:tetratricopeptide repeat protein [Paraglaciecola sp.]|uniref:tetratricopeptide repeat protein n=1 Tax=Paraglaciecola sp. TaxID=1920173 RepID=UPI003EF99F82